ncbi:hypothetical protein HZB58_04015 [Candidatus Gottesmanbacteria bacterium]|nr:hypothetical protein [Candidatus Gottesmanbacteria bacterium]
MHKNTLLLASLLAVIASLLVGFNVGRGMSQSAVPEASPSPKLTPTPTLTYLTESSCGVSFQYPNTLTPMESSGSGLILANLTSPESSIVMVCQEEIPRVPLAPNLMESTSIRAATGTATVAATLYHDLSAKDGSPIDKLIFTHPKTGLDVFIAGYGATFNQLITSLKLQ